MAIDEYHNIDRRTMIELTPKSKKANRHSRSKELIQAIRENCEKIEEVVRKDEKLVRKVDLSAKPAPKAFRNPRLTEKSQVPSKPSSGQSANLQKADPIVLESKANQMRPRLEWSNEKKSKTKDLFGRKCKSKDILEERTAGIFTQYGSTSRESRLDSKNKGSLFEKKSSPLMMNSGSQSSKRVVGYKAAGKTDSKKASTRKLTPQKGKPANQDKHGQNVKIENKDFISKMLNINIVQAKSDLKSPLCYVKAGSNSTSKPSNKHNSPRESTMNTLKEKSRSNETGPKLPKELDLKSVDGTPIQLLQLSAKPTPMETSKFKTSYSNPIQLEQKKKLNQKCKTAGSSKERNTNIKFSKDLLL